MKLNKEDKELLTKCGHSEAEINQVEEAINKTTYTMGKKRISATTALTVLGRENFLSGISRSAFHYSFCRTNENGEEVSFDSSKLFE